MKKLISTLAVSTALVAAPAAAQLVDQWDVDDDGLLSSAEFAPGIETTGWFGDWDVNDDAVLGEREFGTGLFGVFDDNDDGELSVDEWDNGIDAWYGEQAVNLTWSNWDLDADGMLSRAEFRNGMNAGGLYAGFAGRDYRVSQGEFDQGLFDWFEEDDDDLLAEDEWDPLFGLLD